MKNVIFSKRQPLFIAEISANHNGKIQNAKKLIKIAKANGADFVKLQTYTPECMTIDSDEKNFQILVQHKNIEINKQDKWDRTTLIEASKEGHVEIVQILLQHKNIQI